MQKRDRVGKSLGLKKKSSALRDIEEDDDQ